ncbi:DUF3846 domain-containing protein [Pseudomonas sp. IT-P2]|jgi:hypothetical protein|uniref:DUF6572 domain-containing protein n=1 Tax=Pseudomonas sp. IT-P2 TaxID=3026456 RepID=UPI0039E13F05
MSILETKIVDICAVPKAEPDKVVMVIADHLGWEASEEGDHLLMLQEKINTYITFYESGEVFDSLPSAHGKRPVIRIIGKFQLSSEAETFIDSATAVLRNAGIELEFVLKEASGA